MTDSPSTERRKHTPDSVMKKLVKCETEVGKQMEALREELGDHQGVVDEMKADWDQFLLDFTELLTIFRSAKGFFRVLGWIGVAAKWTIGFGLIVAAIWTLVTTGHWSGIGK